MTMIARNVLQMEHAALVAEHTGMDLIEALGEIAVWFGERHPKVVA